MMDVLPTDWSPKKTNLYLAKGANEEEPPPVVEAALLLLLLLLFPLGDFMEDESAFSLIIIILTRIELARILVERESLL